MARGAPKPGQIGRARRTRAFSYLEVVLAMLILAICILPAGRMLPTLLESQRGLETRLALSVIAQQQLESTVLALDASFVASDVSGTLASQGHGEWRHHTVVTVPAAGSGRYAVVRCEAWADANGNATLDADEPQVRFDTLVADRQWGP